MKKIVLLSIASLALFANVSSASAANCGQNYEAQMVTDPITLVVITVQVPTVFLPCEGSDPMAIVQAWGLTGHQTPIVKTGATVTDEAGFTDVCPTWYNVMGCFNLTGTDYYKNQMRTAAKQGVNYHFDSKLNYWLSH